MSDLSKRYNFTQLPHAIHKDVRRAIDACRAFITDYLKGSLILDEMKTKLYRVTVTIDNGDSVNAGTEDPALVGATVLSWVPAATIESPVKYVTVDTQGKVIVQLNAAQAAGNGTVDVYLIFTGYFIMLESGQS